jgi:hypothetical protein
MVCAACEAGRHEDCTLGDCDCQERLQQEAVEQRLRAIRATDERLANMVFTTLLHSPSEVARTLTEGAGRNAVRQFVCQVICTLRSLNC